MLTANHEGAVEIEMAADAAPSHPAKALRLEWIGQTVASLCWLASVFACGLNSTGDWLQLGAAAAWLLANIASVATTKAG